MRFGMIITQTDPKTVFNVLCLALYSLEQGDQVRIFLSGKGVDIDRTWDGEKSAAGLVAILVPTPRNPQNHKVS